MYEEQCGNIVFFIYSLVKSYYLLEGKSFHSTRFSLDQSLKHRSLNSHFCMS